MEKNELLKVLVWDALSLGVVVGASIAWLRALSRQRRERGLRTISRARLKLTVMAVRREFTRMGIGIGFLLIGTLFFIAPRPDQPQTRTWFGTVFEVLLFSINGRLLYTVVADAIDDAQLEKWYEEGG